MQLIRKFNKGFRFLLLLLTFTVIIQVIPLKYKEITVVNAFQKILNKSKLKPNKIWVDEGSEFYNSSMKSFFEKNEIEMYSANNEGKCYYWKIY